MKKKPQKASFPTHEAALQMSIGGTLRENDPGQTGKGRLRQAGVKSITTERIP